MKRLGTACLQVPWISTQGRTRRKFQIITHPTNTIKNLFKPSTFQYFNPTSSSIPRQHDKLQPCLTPSTPIPTHHHLINKPSLPTLPPFILHLQSSYNLLIIIISSFTQWSTSSQSPHTPQTPSHNNPPSVPTCHSSSAKQTSLIGFQTNPHILFFAIRAGKISPNVQSVYPYSVLGNSGPRIWLFI